MKILRLLLCLPICVCVCILLFNRQVLSEVASPTKVPLLLTLEDQHYKDVLHHRMAVYAANDALYTNTSPQSQQQQQQQIHAEALEVTFMAQPGATVEGNTASRDVAGQSVGDCGLGSGGEQGPGSLAAADIKLEDMVLGSGSSTRSSSSSSGDSGEEGLGTMLTSQLLE